MEYFVANANKIIFVYHKITPERQTTTDKKYKGKEGEGIKFKTCRVENIDYQNEKKESKDWWMRV